MNQWGWHFMPDALAKGWRLAEEQSGLRLRPPGALRQVVLVESLPDHCHKTVSGPSDGPVAAVVSGEEARRPEMLISSRLLAGLSQNQGHFLGERAANIDPGTIHWLDETIVRSGGESVEPPPSNPVAGRRNNTGR